MVNKEVTQKECSKCKKTLDISEFYKKGDRLESSCKSCKRKKRNTTYVSKKFTDAHHRLSCFFDLIFEHEHHTLDQLEKNIDDALTNFKLAA